MRRSAETCRTTIRIDPGGFKWIGGGPDVEVDLSIAGSVVPIRLLFSDQTVEVDQAGRVRITAGSDRFELLHRRVLGLG